MRSVSPKPTAQEVLAHPVRQGAMASAAMPGRRNQRHRRFRAKWNSRGHGWGTLMRHILLFGPIPALAFGVCMTTSPARLIAATSGMGSGASCLIGTSRGAVAVTPITVTANDHGGAATRTQVASSRELHGQRGPMGGKTASPLREILCMQRCLSGQRGAVSELAWRLVPMSRRHLHRRSAIYRIDCIGASASPSTAIPSPVALRLPDGSLLRKPPAGSPAGCRLNHYR